ncbi:hypothetical protein [Caballeronia grimmiae]|uniref:hypothetical protein n=1 Tax=Caballeronia grimmiae TaxID=1071679 RepID=UPI0038B7F691
MVGRPIILDMDGESIRLLQNGVAAWDASSLSYDRVLPHERVEIVRWPARCAAVIQRSLSKRADEEPRVRLVVLGQYGSGALNSRSR